VEAILRLLGQGPRLIFYFEGAKGSEITAFNGIIRNFFKCVGSLSFRPNISSETLSNNNFSRENAPINIYFKAYTVY
jgi:hypothetical protein